MSDPRFENVGDIITQTIEECAEVIHILCKVQRFGWNNYHPSDVAKTRNYTHVSNEIADLEKRIARLKIEVEKQANAQQAKGMPSFNELNNVVG
jgi:hypothetical protein